MVMYGNGEKIISNLSLDLRPINITLTILEVVSTKNIIYYSEELGAVLD